MPRERHNPLLGSYTSPLRPLLFRGCLCSATHTPLPAARPDRRIVLPIRYPKTRPSPVLRLCTSLLFWWLPFPRQLILLCIPPIQTTQGAPMSNFPKTPCSHTLIPISHFTAMSWLLCPATHVPVQYIPPAPTSSGCSNFDAQRQGTIPY